MKRRVVEDRTWFVAEDLRGGIKEDIIWVLAVGKKGGKHGLL